MVYPLCDNPVVIIVRFLVLSTPPHCRNTWSGWSGLAIVFTPVKVYLSLFNLLRLLQALPTLSQWPSTEQQSRVNWSWVCADTAWNPCSTALHPANPEFPGSTFLVRPKAHRKLSSFCTRTQSQPRAHRCCLVCTHPEQ